MIQKKYKKSTKTTYIKIIIMIHEINITDDSVLKKRR